MSHDKVGRLVMMANQIESFFVVQPGDAALKIADHLTAFWDPSMRRTIVAHLDETGGEGLRPAAVAAVRLLKNHSSKAVEQAMASSGERSPGHDRGDDAG